MGRYIDWAMVTGRYQDAAKLAGDGPMGSYWLSGAEYEVDGFLASRYTVPFTPAPPIVQDLCIDLTYYKMTIQQKNSEKLWKYIEKRIEMIINGTLVIGTSGPAGVAWSSAEGHHTSFGPDDPINWRISSSWAQDVEEARES